MFKVEQKVRYTNVKAHETDPQFYPPVGWHGTIKELDENAEQALVEWGNGSGTQVDPEGGHAWWSGYEWLEAVDNG